MKYAVKVENDGHTFFLCWSKKNGHATDIPPNTKNGHTFFLCHVVKNGHTSRNQNGTGTRMYKTLTKGDERNIGVKVIPRD